MTGMGGRITPSTCWCILGGEGLNPLLGLSHFAQESSVSYASSNLGGVQRRAELIPRGIDDTIVFSPSVGVLDLFGSQLVGF